MFPCPLRGDQAVMLADRNQLAGKLICARICARDAAGWVETRETQRTRHGRTPSVGRGQRGGQRRRETSETYVVWLITQRCVGVCDSCIWLMTMAVPWTPTLVGRCRLSARAVRLRMDSR